GLRYQNPKPHPSRIVRREWTWRVTRDARGDTGLAEGRLVMEIDTRASGKDEMFRALRPSLHAVAYHMLANTADAEDMVQESFLRWQKTDASLIKLPKAFLTTVFTRLCLKHLQSARVQREASFGSAVPEGLEGTHADASDAH